MRNEATLLIKSFIRASLRWRAVIVFLLQSTARSPCLSSASRREVERRRRPRRGRRGPRHLHLDRGGLSRFDSERGESLRSLLGTIAGSAARDRSARHRSPARSGASQEEARGPRDRRARRRGLRPLRLTASVGDIPRRPTPPTGAITPATPLNTPRWPSSVAHPLRRGDGHHPLGTQRHHPPGARTPSARGSR